MTKKLLFLMFAAFSMKRKRTKISNLREPNARRTSFNGTPLLGKNTWGIVHSFSLPQNEQKFNKMHKSFSQFPTKYRNISDQINYKFRTEYMNWRFFEHLETQKVAAENVTEKANFGTTPLHFAVVFNMVEIVKGVIEAGVDINSKAEDDLSSRPLYLATNLGHLGLVRRLITAGANLNIGMTALHWAAHWDHLEIGIVLVEDGADLDIKWNNQTALEIAVKKNHGAFAEMLRTHMKI